MKEITKALLSAQKEMGNAKKDATNPFFKSKYADLNSVREAVMPILNHNGILVLQPMITIEGNEYVRTVLLHESGEMIESFTKILCKSQNDPQAYGSGVTYARRYGLQSLMSIGADDDDGNKASIEPKKQVQQSTDVNKAIDEMEAVKSRSEMDVVWHKYVGLQKDVHFLEAVKKMSAIYPKTI